MKAKTLLALALATAASAPAAAGDFDYGYRGMKDVPAGVPVPAPVPVYDTFRWYVRTDLGGGWRSQPSVKQDGIVYGTTDSKTPLSPGSSWFTSEFNTFFTGGIGAGIYLTPRLRGDLTFDFSSEADVKGSGAFAYNQYSFTPLPGTDTGLVVRGTMSDHTKMTNSIGLVNLYYDLVDRGSFTPYIGIGAGLVVRHITRTHSTVETLYDPVQNTSTAYGTISSRHKDVAVAPAAAATAGFSYTISPGVLVDLNYRLTYLGAVDANLTVNGQTSKVAIGDSLEHAVRAGLRWNVW